MKYLKISSLLVLSLLLFAPAAQAAVKCDLASESHDLRAESMHEMLGALEVRCSWAANDFAEGTATSDPMFDFDITFSEDITNADDMQPYLEFKGMADGMGGDTATTKVMPDDIGSDDIEWDDVAFPFANNAVTPATTWANGDWEGETSGEFWIKGVYLDASGGDDEVTASIRMTVPSPLFSPAALQGLRGAEIWAEARDHPRRGGRGPVRGALRRRSRPATVRFFGCCQF